MSKRQKIIEALVDKKKVTLLLGDGRSIKFYCSPLDAYHLKQMLEEVFYIEIGEKKHFPESKRGA